MKKIYYVLMAMLLALPAYAETHMINNSYQTDELNTNVINIAEQTHSEKDYEIDVISLVNNIAEISIDYSIQKNHEIVISGDNKSVFEAINGYYYLPVNQIYTLSITIHEETSQYYIEKFYLNEYGMLETLMENSYTKSNSITRSINGLYEDEPNDEMTYATETENDENNYGNIDSASDEDWWVVSFPYDGIANFWLGDIPSGCDYDICLWDSDGYSLEVSDNSNNSQELIQYEVRAYDEYYIQITGWLGSYDASSDYLFRAKAYPVIELDVPLHIQETTTTCGSACGVMILDYHGIDVTESDFVSLNKQYHGGQYTYVYAVTNTINLFFDEYNETTEYDCIDVSSYSYDEIQLLIANSLMEDHPVQMPMEFYTEDYFPYTTISSGHYMVLGGLYYDTDSSNEMSVMYDPHYEYGDIYDVPLEEIIEYNENHSSWIIYSE